MTYDIASLSNGLRIVHMPSSGPVAYCGFAVDAGARDEAPDAHGLAHFTEHMLFKGTGRRRAWHILNRMEAVGGELNAYTTKEETLVYASFLAQDFGRAAELLSDLVLHSRFPEGEAEKEIEVIADEINSYRDNPSELIFDAFENDLFADHAIGHYILGTEESLSRLGPESGRAFLQRFYVPENLLFFSMGPTPFRRIVRRLERLFADVPGGARVSGRTPPAAYRPMRRRESMDTFQSHVVIGNRCGSLYDERRPALALLNNLLGGPGMNSRLNLSLRERHGYVYGVESSVTGYTDTGIFTLYFGTDPKNRDRALALAWRELKRLREERLTGSQLQAAKRQLIGQIGVGSDNRENRVLALAKSMLRFGRYDSVAEVAARIEKVTASGLQELAVELFDERQLSELIFD